MAGAVKSLGVTLEEALYGISFSNLILFGACLPTYGDEAEGGEEVDAGDSRSVAKVMDFFS